MKMVRKILLGLVATAAVLSLVSCGQVKEDEEKAIDGENIGFKNEKTENYRGFITTKTKHYSANAEITIDNPKEIANSSHNANAVLGFVFGVEEVKHDPVVQVYKKNDKNEDEVTDVTFYNFGIASVRYNKAGNVEWYVSWCKDVPNTILGYNDSPDFGNISVKDINNVTKTYGSEKQILPTSGTFETVSGINLTEDNKLSVLIKTVANDGKKDSELEAGSYTVSLCNAKGEEKSSVKIPATETGLTKKTELLIGRYVTVYAGEEIKGTIKYSDIKGNVIPADYVEE